MECLLLGYDRTPTYRNYSPTASRVLTVLLTEKKKNRKKNRNKRSSKRGTVARVNCSVYYQKYSIKDAC